jgi:hypothetical protein
MVCLFALNWKMTLQGLRHNLDSAKLSSSLVSRANTEHHVYQSHTYIRTSSALSLAQIFSKPLAICYRASMRLVNCIECDIAVRARAGSLVIVFPVFFVGGISDRFN